MNPVEARNIEVIKGLFPKTVGEMFALISSIPRGSGNEKEAADRVVGIANKHGFRVKRDRINNVVVYVPASPGFEDRPSTVLQGHLDMVCEKNADKVHDFSKDPIELVRNGNLLMANGTTLGADNGIAVATNLAIMDDPTLEHGPLELLFTVDEETGLTGAASLQPGFIESRTLLNLDSEEEGAIYVGCSGGRDTLATWNIAFEAAPAGTIGCTLKVTGLKGGHSGLEIDKGRGNAIKIINRVLTELATLGSRLSALNGGNKRNAIPRECDAAIFIPKKNLDQARAMVESLNDTLRAEISTVDPDLQVTLIDDSQLEQRLVVVMAQQQMILSALAALPHGVLKMSADIPGLVETSTNVAVISTTKKAIVLSTSQRSSVASELAEAVQSVSTILRLSGAGVENSDGYPGWKPNLDSKILQLAKATYQSLYGQEPQIKAIHAGLECGIIGERFPGIDMISFGPTLEGVHSPDEKIYIDSVEKFYNFLLALLKNIGAPATPAA